MKLQKQILPLLIIMIVLMGFFYISLNPLKEAIDFCEDKEWNNSTYELDLGIIKEDIVEVRCNKEEAESDALVRIIQSLYFWEERDSDGGRN